jgi:hypothetical protein
MAAPTTATGGRAMVSVFDGTRKLYSNHAALLITARDGNLKDQSRKFHDSSSVFLTDLPLFDNFGDNYAFLAAADGYKDAGFFPVKLAPKVVRFVDLMLIPNSNSFNFAEAKWNVLEATRPEFKALFASGAATDDAADTRYSALEEGGEVLACLLNITTAMQQIHLPKKTAFEYLERVIWDNPKFPMAKDRFFTWADPELIDQLEEAKRQIPPTFEDAPFGLHPGATGSYKQIQFGQANVQFTIHKNEVPDEPGVNWVMVELDIDYFMDPGAHLLLEVARNAVFHSLTDPREVYVLRWIAGRRAGIPEFDPLYTIQKA